MGFCIFGNVAIAARYARARHGVDRVLIVDWDVHHGNGTQALVENESDIRFVSMHQWPWYPGTGAAEDRGPHGTIWNVPMAPGLPAERYLCAFLQAVDTSTSNWAPDLVLVSAGFDAVILPPPLCDSDAVFGFLERKAVQAVDALDRARSIPRRAQTGLQLQHKTFPAWALRLLLAALLAAPLIVAIDGLARVRRRGLGAGRWTLWTLACGLPFLACALFARLLGASGVLGVAPATPLPPSGLHLGGAALSGVAAVALVLALAWLMWPMLVRRLGLTAAPHPEAAGVTTLLALLVVAVLAWAINPFAALLLLPAAHLWLLVVSPELRPRRAGSHP